MRDGTLRLSLYLGGLACFNGMTLLHYLPGGYHNTATLGICGLLLAGLALFYLACLREPPRLLARLSPYRRLLLALGLSSVLWASWTSLGDIAHIPRELARPRHYWNDAIAMTDCAVRLFLRGPNPYTALSVTDCFARNHLTGAFSTPLQAGAFARVRVYPSKQQRVRLFALAVQHHVLHPAEFESRFSYPAGAFVLPAPFVALGWPELSTFYIAWIVLSYLLLGWLAPRRLRVWLIPLALGNLAVWDYAIHGFSEGLVVFLLLTAWLSWRRPWLSAVLMGAAIATRQEAWLFAPFYAILVGRTYGWRDLARRLTVMAGIFALANGPFVMQSAGAWFDGVLSPLRDPMFPGGEGLIELGTAGWLPLWPRSLYTVLEGATLLACSLLYARLCRREPGVGMVLALVPLVLAWRGLFVYFFLPLPILCLWPLPADGGTGHDTETVSGEKNQRAN